MMNKQLYKFYFEQFKGIEWSMLLALGGSLLQFIPYYFIFRLIRNSFDHYIPSKDLSALSFTVASIVLLFLVKSGLGFLVKYHTLKINKNFIANLRYKIVEKIQSISYLNSVHLDATKYHMLTVQHSEKVYFLNNSLINQAIPALMASLIFLIFLFYTNFALTLLIFLILVPLFFITKVFLYKLSSEIKETTKQFKNFNRRIIFMMRALDLTKTLSGENFEIAKQKNNIEQLNLAEAKLNLRRIGVNLIHDLIFSLFGVIILMVGGYSVIKESMSLGSMLSYYAAVVIFKNYLQAFFVTLPQMEEGRESLVELYDFFAKDVAIDYFGVKKLESIAKISLKAVTFAYQNESLLKNIDLEIKPGKMIVISGLNGSGKTTLLNLIMGLIRPTNGTLFADDISYDELDLKSLRMHLGLLRQTPYIFKGTVSENISYGRVDVSESELKEVAALTGALTFIEKLPQGFESVIGDSGMSLSGGQCQKLALCRAMLRKPRLLFLDEPTNHLDINSIIDFIENLKKNYKPFPACLIISHEPAIIEKADVHYLLQNGRLEIL